ncbi:hypothetical protein SANTM175S_02662 [Streptomyces antimycoticus]
MAVAAASIWSRLACGGIGGTAGSVRKSMTNGRSAPSALCQAASPPSGFSTRTPPRPMEWAKSAYRTSGRAWQGRNCGAPDMARISQVTWLRSWLLRTATISRGSRHSDQYLAAVMSSAMPFICMAPSPTMASAGRSGWANLAPMTYGTPGPMVARVPDSEPRMDPRMRRWRAYQFAAEPESAARITSWGSRASRAWTTYSGLMGSASTAARRSMTCHQRAVSFSIFLRHDPCFLRFSWGSSARSVSRASPTRLTSKGYRSPTMNGSMSICTARAWSSSGMNWV